MADRSAGRRLQVRALGAAFLALVVLGGWLTYAVFTKRFVDYDEVTLRSSTVGLSLPARADVKIRGVQVGEVLATRTDGDGASLTLGLYPDQRRTIPANVTAQILPKTLFGEKYVALQVPRRPSPDPIRPGAVITRTRVAVEVEAVLNDLYPLLRTVRPDQLSSTLNAVADALEGRGDRLGDGLLTLDDYLRGLNPEVPALVASLDRLGGVASTYDGVVPELARLLRNTVTTTGTLESKQQQITTLFRDVSGLSATTETFLRRNGDNLVTLADQGRQVLPLLARYSPEYRCFLDGAAASVPREDQVFRDHTLHIVLETLPRQPRAYTADEVPRSLDRRGPFRYCPDLVKGMQEGYGQDNLQPRRLVPDIADGVRYPLAKRAAPGARVGDATTDGVVGTAEEQDVLDLVSAPVLGVPVDDVPDLATLLLGPLARGRAVDVR